MDFSIKELLNSAFNNPGLKARARENMVFPLWNVVVGPKISLKAHPYKLEDGILKVVVSSSTWAQQLTFMKEQIIRGYLDLIGEELVKDIRFHTGKILPGAEKNNDKPEQLVLDFTKYNLPDDFQLSLIKLSTEKQMLIEEQVKSIKDEELKKQVCYLMEKDLKTNAWKEKMGWKPCPQCNVLIEPKDRICMICGIQKSNDAPKKRGRKKKS